jgi:hypothetical protein
VLFINVLQVCDTISSCNILLRGFKDAACEALLLYLCSWALEGWSCAGGRLARERLETYLAASQIPLWGYGLPALLLRSSFKNGRESKSLS